MQMLLRRYRHRKPYYVRIFSLTFLVLAVIVLLLELVVYWGLNREFTTAMRETQSTMVEQVQNSAEALLRQAEKAVMTLTLRDTLIRFATDGFPRADYDSFLFTTELLSLGLLGTDSGYVHSVSVYNSERGLVLTPGGIESVDNSPNGELLRRLDPGFPLRSWVIQPVDAEQSSYVISYAASVPLSANGPTYLMLNLEASFFERSFFSLTEATETALIVLDGEGNELVSGGDGRGGLQREALDVDDLEGRHGFISLEGASAFFTKSTSPYSEWTYVTVTPAQNVRSYAGGLLRFVVIALLGFLLFALLLSLGLARIIYRPVKRLHDSVRTRFTGQDGELAPGSEIDLIERRFQEIYDTNLEYQARFEEDRVLLREKHLWDLVHGRLQDGVDYGQFLEAEIEDGKTAISVVAVEHDERLGKGTHLSTYIHREIDERVHAGVAGRGDVLFVLADHHRTLAVIATHSRQETREFAHDLSASIEKELGVTFFIACGIEVACLEDTSVSLASADRLLYKKRYSAGSVILPEQFGASADTRHKRYSGVEKSVNDFRLDLERGNWESLSETIDRMIVTPDGLAANVYYRESKILQLANILLSYAILHVDEEEWLTREGDPWSVISSLRSPDELREWFHTWLAIIRSSFEQRATSAQYRWVEKAVEYCRSTFRQNRTIQDVASAIGISPSYLSTIFKQEKGVSFFEFMLNLRLDEAKRALSETDDTLDVVAQKSGFGNKRTLTRSFKKAVGQTPGAYRSRTAR